ncbi:MAG: hypothetical protein HC904_07905 [Blastochloris sp.]|nr:hypothetical protein [Blastochloris sp.]
MAPNLDRKKMAAEAFLLGTVTGLGLRAMENVPVEVNLVPLSVQEQGRKKGQLPYLATAVVVWILLFVLASGAFWWKLSTVSATVEQLQSDLSNKQALSAAIDRSAREVAKDKERMDGYERLMDQRDFWPTLMETLIKTVSNYTGLWVSQVDLSFNGNPVEVIPTNLIKPPAAATPPPRGNRAGAAAPARASANAAMPEHLNLAPKGTELNIRGFYEATQPFDMLNQFVEDLKKTEKFETVEIISRESLNNDQVALQFFIRAVFKENQQPDLLP